MSYILLKIRHTLQIASFSPTIVWIVSFIKVNFHKCSKIPAAGNWVFTRQPKHVWKSQLKLLIMLSKLFLSVSSQWLIQSYGGFFLWRYSQMRILLKIWHTLQIVSFFPSIVWLAWYIKVNFHKCSKIFAARNWECIHTTAKPFLQMTIEFTYHAKQSIFVCIIIMANSITQRAFLSTEDVLKAYMYF